MSNSTFSHPLAEQSAVIIDAANNTIAASLLELWQRRELLYFLVARDLKVRYRQTAMGFLWALLQPLFTMGMFNVVFGRLGNMPSDGLPYPLFCLAGIVPWMFFQSAVSQAANSLVNNSSLLSKIYLPRLALPLSAVGATLVDLMISLAMLLAMLVYYRLPLRVEMLCLPLFLLLCAMAAAGVGVWLATINVRYRDVRYILPFILQIWMFASPIAYPATLIPDTYRYLYSLNPLVVIVSGVRWSLLGTPSVPVPQTGVAIVITVVLLITGIMYFVYKERDFADVL